jgi:hypothetical protein
MTDFDFGKRDRPYSDEDDLPETPVAFNPPVEYNPSKKIIEYSFAAIFMIVGLVGIYFHVEYAGWAIFLAIMIGW